MRSISAVAMVLQLCVVAPAAAQEQDTELQEAQARCNDVLSQITRGRGAYPDLGVIYNWRRFHQLFDSKDRRVRRLAATTQAKLVSWDWYFGPGVKYLDKTNDPYVRAAVLASLLRDATLDVSARSRGYVRERRAAVAPVFRELLTAPTAPPYLDVILRFVHQHQLPKVMIPDDQGKRELMTARIISAAALIFKKARTQSAEDYPETTFMNTITREPYSPERRDFVLKKFRKRDRETAARVLFVFAETMSQEFWAELRDFLQTTQDLEFRRFVVTDFLAVLEDKESQVLKTLAVPTLEILSADWDETVQGGAQRLLGKKNTAQMITDEAPIPGSDAVGQ